MKARTPSYFIVGACLLMHLKCTSCLRDLLLTLPPAASLGEKVQLNCTYHLQGEDLYAVKLYKGRHEFLTFLPDRDPPLRQFPRKGLNIENVLVHGEEPKQTRGLTVMLDDVNLFTTGKYGCEASAEESFHTDLVWKKMTVLVKPVERPTVVGFKPRYRIGDTLQMTCYVNETFPSANITWFITGKRVDEKYRQNKVLTSPTTSLKTTQSILALPLGAHHFQGGNLVAKCVASMLTMHWQSADVTIKEESPTLASVVDNANGGTNNTVTVDTKVFLKNKDSSKSVSSSHPSMARGADFLWRQIVSWLILNTIIQLTR